MKDVGFVKKRDKFKRWIFFIVLVLILLVLFLIFCIDNNKNSSINGEKNTSKNFNVIEKNMKTENNVNLLDDYNVEKGKKTTENCGKNQRKIENMEQNNSIAEKKDSNYFQNKDFSDWNKNCDWNLILLNDKNKIPNGTFPDLADYKDVKGKKYFKVNAGILACLDEMIKFAKKDNIDLWVSSCYRDIDYQTFLYNKKIKFYLDKGNNRSVAENLAKKVVAEPGTSEHNLGLAVDFNDVRDDFYLTDAYKWLIKHSDEYGFILRYGKDKKEITNKIYEPWHFRYVGKDHAKKMKSMSICLEEYIDLLMRPSK